MPGKVLITLARHKNGFAASGFTEGGEAVLLSFFASEFQQNMLLKNDRVCVKMKGEKRKGAISVYRGAESSENRAGR